ncbi:hypothetical protein F5148DRAFT_254215 [Russula earlei]|uniref:Uncharacterized protein n=1 Tax=Russula earlei TaxID=71964 RepID=A0ACC0U373_9AGAM|nr:hypothetical protein F5148DRAFT_254215 [Russula earlei]
MHSRETMAQILLITSLVAATHIPAGPAAHELHMRGLIANKHFLRKVMPGVVSIVTINYIQKPIGDRGLAQQPNGNASRYHRRSLDACLPPFPAERLFSSSHNPVSRGLADLCEENLRLLNALARRDVEYID